MKLKRPDLQQIRKGSRYLCRVKIGGESQLVNVVCKCEPYQKDYGKARQAWYVNVYGYGFSCTVMACKLQISPTKQDILLWGDEYENKP